MAACVLCLPLTCVQALHACESDLTPAHVLRIMRVHAAIRPRQLLKGEVNMTRAQAVATEGCQPIVRPAHQVVLGPLD